MYLDDEDVNLNLQRLEARPHSVVPCILVAMVLNLGRLSDGNRRER